MNSSRKLYFVQRDLFCFLLVLGLERLVCWHTGLLIWWIRVWILIISWQLHLQIKQQRKWERELMTSLDLERNISGSVRSILPVSESWEDILINLDMEIVLRFMMQMIKNLWSNRSVSSIRSIQRWCRRERSLMKFHLPKMNLWHLLSMKQDISMILRRKRSHRSIKNTRSS